MDYNNNTPCQPAESGQFAVLMVEDSPAQALKTKVVLENNNCYVCWAENGTKGLALANQHKFDLIILDIELPDTTGFEICRTLKAQEKFVDIPVIMLTTRDQADDVLSGLDAGAIDYIPKDAFAEAVLVETVKQMRQL